MEEPRAPSRVLLVEDDPAISELVATYLGRDGLSVFRVASAEEGLASLEPPPDLVVLDLGLPGMDGLDFLRAFRRSSLAPVMIVSARESDEDKLAGLGLGADDFVTKPFSPRVLAARAGALLRRAGYARGGSAGPGARPVPAGLAFGPFLLDPEAGLLERGGRPVALSRREFELLLFLVSRPGRSYSAAELHREVWHLDYGDISTVAVHIQRLRRKLGEDPAAPRWIRTVPGAGYRFAPEGGDS